jgi:hypothetical protein
VTNNKKCGGKENMNVQIVDTFRLVLENFYLAENIKRASF